MTDPYLAVCLQPLIRQAHNRTNVKENFERISKLIHATAFLRKRWPHGWVQGDVKLVAFPEYCFSDWRGIALGDIDPMDVAIEIPGDEVEPLVSASVEENVYVAAQALEIDKRFPGHFFNAAFIISPSGKIIYKRHKLRHLLLTLYTSPNDILDEYVKVFGRGKTIGQTVFPVVETPIGKLGMCVCHEVATPEVARQLAANGAEVVIRSTNEPETGWVYLDRARALENVMFWVVGNSGPSEYQTSASDYGHSRIIGFRGEILGESGGAGETAAGGLIDLDALRKVKEPGLPPYSTAVFDYHQIPSIPANMFLKGRLSRKEIEETYVRLGLYSHLATKEIL